MHNPNELFIEEMNNYHRNPVKACSAEEARKLLRKFGHTDFPTFWNSPIERYLPAVSAGIMYEKQFVLSHDEAIKFAKSLLKRTTHEQLAEAFIFGVSHKTPEYRTALAAYWYIKNLPEHEKSAYYAYFDSDGNPIYNQNKCEHCKYQEVPFNEPKMGFWGVNIDSFFFYEENNIPFYIDLNTAIFILSEFLKLSKVNASKSDFNLFIQSLKLTETLSKGKRCSEFRKVLMQSKILPMTEKQISSYIDLLGYLNILHAPNDFGVTKKITQTAEMTDSDNIRTYFAYPAYTWASEYGIDYRSVVELFGNLKCYNL